MARMGLKTNGIARMSRPSISRPANKAIDPTRVPNPFFVTSFFPEEGATYTLALLPVWGECGCYANEDECGGEVRLAGDHPIFPFKSLPPSAHSLKSLFHFSPCSGTTSALSMLTAPPNGCTV
ncbi:hypothetical protein BDN67DRAFT_973131 [Paxillus ammoniavirescens]|nr:hypothetical protein BDN67DRAFT_973131 [Paxillus ammoniavirescens]